MKFIRRVLFAMFATVLAAAAIRLRSPGETPTQHGGWRPLDVHR